MIICLCEGVSSREIAVHVKNGATTLEELAQKCSAGIGCGSCHEQILEIIAKTKSLEEPKPCDIAAQGVYRNV